MHALVPDPPKRSLQLSDFRRCDSGCISCKHGADLEDVDTTATGVVGDTSDITATKLSQRCYSLEPSIPPTRREDVTQEDDVECRIQNGKWR